MMKTQTDPPDNKPSLYLPEKAMNLQKPFTGEGKDASGAPYRVRNGIIERLGHRKTGNQKTGSRKTGNREAGNSKTRTWRLRTPAQLSNLIPLTAVLYEDLWRKRSLSILGREPFSLEEEFRVLIRWLKPKEGGRYLDVGCSTALYGRAIKEACSQCDVVALDYSRPMLREAAKRAAAEQADLYLVRADALEMPFLEGTFDGLAMGGTLNELRKPARVLEECRRVIREDGVFFCMYLLKATKPVGKLAQWAARLGGISFWSKNQSARLFQDAGFKVKKRLSMGVVCMVLLEPVARR